VQTVLLHSLKPAREAQASDTLSLMDKRAMTPSAQYFRSPANFDLGQITPCNEVQLKKYL